MQKGRLFASLYGPGGNPAGASGAFQAGLRRKRVTGTFSSVVLRTPPSPFDTRHAKREAVSLPLWTWRESNPRPKICPPEYLPSQFLV